MILSPINSVASSPLPCLASGHVQRLLFLCTLTDPDQWTQNALQEWEASHRVRYHTVGVSGFLLFNAPFLFEVIEGFPEVVKPLFHLIGSDHRRQRPIVLSDVRCSERVYPDWRMHVVGAVDDLLPAMIQATLRTVASSFLSMWKYIPRSAAGLLVQGKDPRTHPPEPQDVVVSFIQLVGFSALLAEPSLEPLIADVMNAFVDVCIRTVEESGGQVANFLNGVCMAYWPGGQAIAAYTGVRQVAAQLEDLRERQPLNATLSLLYAQAGLHCGHALLCNAGMQKADFTLLGDCVNVAARITALAGPLEAAVVVTADLRIEMGDLGRTLVDVGSQQLRGRSEPVHCYKAPGPALGIDLVLAPIKKLTAEWGPWSQPKQPVRPYKTIPLAERPPIFEDNAIPLKAARNPAPFGCLSVWRRALRLPRPPPPTQLMTLMYISHASCVMTRSALGNLQRKAFRANQAAGITGELLVIDRLFLHTIEGPTAAVDALWAVLIQDPRHVDPVLVYMAPITQRKYDNPLRLTICDEKLLGGLPMLADLLGQLARSMSCVETYVPNAVVRHLLSGRESRMFAPVRVSVVMMASDIVCFTSLSEGCLLTEVWHMCTTFIDLCTREIQMRGGQVIKLIGDCVKAYFPPGAAMAAMEAAQGLTRNCARRRQTVHPLDCRSVMACGVGLDYGPVVMMHSGNASMSKFIVTGEISGRVMEVEALSRPAGRKIILTQALRDQLPTELPVERLPEPCQGVPCYALSGPEWQLDWGTIEKSIKKYHEECRIVRSASVAFLRQPAPPQMDGTTLEHL